VKVTLGQFDPSADVARNRDVVSRFAAVAAAAQAELLVLPEETMATAGLVDGDLNDFAAAHWPAFVQHLRDTARAHAIAIIAGGYEVGGPLPYNTLAAVDSSGGSLATYRKMHLYDAFAYQESQQVLRGDGGPCVIRVGGFTIGLINCYDLRFPEFSRALVEMGADVLSVSAAWVNGPLKEDHWTTLIRARALENTCWVVAAGVASSQCIGRSMAVDPLGVTRVALGEERDWSVTVELTKERLDEARAILPVLRNRRIINRLDAR